MKIAIDIRPIGQQRTGDEVYTLNLVQNLIKIDSDNFYFLLTNTKDEKRLEDIKIKIFGINSNIPKNFKIISIIPANKLLWTFFFLPLWILKSKVDVLHVQYITPLFFLGKTKLITTIHDVSFDAHPEFIKKTDLLFLKTLIPLSLRRVDKVIAVSNFTKKEITKYHKISSGKIHVIYNGDAARSFFQEFTEDQIIDVSRKYKLKDPFIFHIGTLQPRKNIPFLLKSFQLFQKKYSQENSDVLKTSLYLTGDLGRHNSDQRIKKTLNQIQVENPEIFRKIKFIGYVEEKDLPIIFKMAKVAVSTSLYEGFGLPMIEAMIAGVPVVSNNESCLGEIAGDAVEFYQQNNQNDLAKKIFEVTINRNLRERLIRQGVERAKYFKWEKCAQETLRLYKSIKK